MSRAASRVYTPGASRSDGCGLPGGYRWTAAFVGRFLPVGLALHLQPLGAAWGVRAAEGESVAAWESDLRGIAEDQASVGPVVGGDHPEHRAYGRCVPDGRLAGVGPARGSTPFPVEDSTEKHLQHLFDTVCREAGFASVILVDPKGTVLASGGNATASDKDPVRLREQGVLDIPSIQIDADAEGCAARFVEPVR